MAVVISQVFPNTEETQESREGDLTESAEKVGEQFQGEKSGQKVDEQTIAEDTNRKEAAILSGSCRVTMQECRDNNRFFEDRIMISFLDRRIDMLPI